MFVIRQLVFIVLFVTNLSNEVAVFQKTESTVDHKSYIVQTLPDHQRAADILARISKSLDRLVSKLKSTLPSDARVKKLTERYRPGNIQESETRLDKTSFTVNKGEQIHLCLRSPNTGKFEDENTIRYIALHELSHVMSESTGHTEEFWENFRYFTIIRCLA